MAHTPHTRGLTRRSPHMAVPCTGEVWDMVGWAGMDMEDMG